MRSTVGAMGTRGSPAGRGFSPSHSLHVHTLIDLETLKLAGA